MTARISKTDYLRCGVPGPRRKYGNVKQQVEGITFDSKGELKLWHDLCVRQGLGEITELERQVTYVLCPPVRLVGEGRAASVRIIVDFRFLENGAVKLVDYKGYDTPGGRMKRRLLKHQTGLDVHVVRAGKGA